MLSILSRFLGKRITVSDLLALGAFGIGALVTFLDLIGLWDVWSTKPIEVVVLLLLTTLILYSVQEKWEIARRNEDLQRVVKSHGAIDVVKSERELFEGAISIIKSEPFDVVRIYAPVGLWRQSPDKKKWFKALVKCLDPAHQSISELRAVFGLPPDRTTFDSVSVPELEIFKQMDAARLRYIPPSRHLASQLSGTGLLIIGTDITGFALAAHGHHTVSDSAVILHSAEATSEAILWFDGVWEGVKDYRLKECRYGITLDEGIAEAKTTYNTLCADTSDSHQD